MEKPHWAQEMSMEEEDSPEKWAKRSVSVTCRNIPWTGCQSITGNHTLTRIHNQGQFNVANLTTGMFLWCGKKTGMGKSGKTPQTVTCAQEQIRDPEAARWQCYPLCRERHVNEKNTYETWVLSFVMHKYVFCFCKLNSQRIKVHQIIFYELKKKQQHFFSIAPPCWGKG